MNCAGYQSTKASYQLQESCIDTIVVAGSAGFFAIAVNVIFSFQHYLDTE